MKKLLLLIFTLVSFYCEAQTQNDIALIEEEVLNKSFNQRRVNSRGLYALYKNHFTDQIVNSCLYDQSCSTFSHGAIKNFGLIKGIFLTADRISRCNRITYAETHKAFIDTSGKIIDHWEDYGKKK